MRQYHHMHIRRLRKELLENVNGESKLESPVYYL
jgi:hypothetical protein